MPSCIMLTAMSRYVISMGVNTIPSSLRACKHKDMDITRLVVRALVDNSTAHGSATACGSFATVALNH